MSDDARLARLSGELDAALARINALQQGTADTKKPPLPSRVAAHVNRRGSLILNAALAGAAFAVAAGRLSMQRQHEVRPSRAEGSADAFFSLFTLNPRLEDPRGALLLTSPHPPPSLPLSQADRRAWEDERAALTATAAAAAAEVDGLRQAVEAAAEETGRSAWTPRGAAAAVREAVAGKGRGATQAAGAGGAAGAPPPGSDGGQGEGQARRVVMI